MLLTNNPAIAIPGRFKDCGVNILVLDVYQPGLFQEVAKLAPQVEHPRIVVFWFGGFLQKRNAEKTQKRVIQDLAALGYAHSPFLDVIGGEWGGLASLVEESPCLSEAK